METASEKKTSRRSEDTERQSFRLRNDNRHMDISATNNHVDILDVSWMKQPLRTLTIGRRKR